MLFIAGLVPACPHGRNDRDGASIRPGSPHLSCKPDSFSQIYARATLGTGVVGVSCILNDLPF